MSYKVASIGIAVTVVDEFNAIKRGQPIEFSGDAEGTAVEKAQAWLVDIDNKLTEAQTA